MAAWRRKNPFNKYYMKAVYVEERIKERKKRGANLIFTHKYIADAWYLNSHHIAFIFKSGLFIFIRVAMKLK